MRGPPPQPPCRLVPSPPTETRVESPWRPAFIQTCDPPPKVSACGAGSSRHRLSGPGRLHLGGVKEAAIRVHEKRRAVGAGPCVPGYGTTHPSVRRSLGVLLAIAFTVALTSCGASSDVVRVPTTSAGVTPTPASGGPTTSAGVTPVSASGASTSPAEVTSTAPAAVGDPARRGIAVPLIVGQTIAQAAITLSQVGLRVGTTTYVHTAEYGNKVIAESVPTQGTIVNPNSQINITVSKGCACISHPPIITVPAVAGDTLSQAEAALSQAGGLSVGTISYQPSDVVGQGVVISSSPPGGEQVNAVSTGVDLTVSSGP